ncbi:hypothetical protein CARUB_v10002782mg [Capsella rubella]|uniref:Uncharacterized protein n=1 Tax=Capsella rubella TaxID=81985 RepID=R0H4I6_9BRAS|nr:hypothetical protein CARUB_v10002782mg [Capsella rubella]
MQQDAITSLIPCLSKPGEGVYVTASTIISLKTVVERLTAPFPQLNNIPVSALGLGPVTTGDIFKAHKLFLEGGTGNPLFATVLAFSVPLTRNASKLAETLGVKVISSAISVDHLHRQFEEYTNELRMEKQKTEAHDSAFSPCVLCILPKCVLNKEDPIVVGVYVLEGSVSVWLILLLFGTFQRWVGTPLCVPNRAFINVGRVAWIEKDQQPVEDARQGEKVIIKLSGLRCHVHFKRQDGGQLPFPVTRFIDLPDLHWGIFTVGDLKNSTSTFKERVVEATAKTPSSLLLKFFTVSIISVSFPKPSSLKITISVISDGVSPGILTTSRSVKLPYIEK